MGVPIRNIADYSPFGVQLDGRTIQGDFYRFGYQGSEKDDEAKGGGNSYTTYYRQLDPRVGRWFSIDPIPEAGMSPYSSMDNSPIKLNDILGLYTEKGAERRAKRGRKQGYDTEVKHNDGAGKNDYGVSYHKRNETNTGSYMAHQYKGKFNGIGGEGLVMDKEVTIEIIDSEKSKIIESLKSKVDKVNWYSGLTNEGLTTIISSQFKSNSNNYSFQKLTERQTNWRTMAILGKSGKPIMQTLKWGGAITGVAVPVIHSVEMYQKANDNDPSTVNSTMDKVDLGVESVVGVTGILAAFGVVSNPIGWCVAIGGMGYSTFRYSQQNPETFKSFRAEPGLNACFIEGTLVTMFDGSLKRIEKISIGDFVLSYNFQLEKIQPRKVLELASPIHDKLIKIKFESGVENNNTFDHPYFIKEKGWASFDPIMTFTKYNIRVKQIEVGDICYLYEQNLLKELKIVSLTELNGVFQTYNLNNVDENNNFFANGVLVHNKVSPSIKEIPSKTILTKYKVKKIK